MALDLESLRLLAWALLAATLIGFVLFEGLTLGVIVLLPVLGTDDADRGMLLRSIAPTTLSSMGWLILVVTLLFGAWPVVYAASMLSFYWFWVFLLIVIVFRPFAVFFLPVFTQPEWQKIGFKLLIASGVVPAVALGLAAGNLLKGVPFHLDSDMRILFMGNFSGLFSLFALLIMLTCVALLVLHGSIFVQLRSQSELQQRAKGIVFKAGLVFLALFALSGLWITHLEGYHITSDILPNMSSNPLAKFVKRGEGLWLDNYEHQPLLWCLPLLAFLSASCALWLSRVDKHYWAMMASSVCVSMAVLTYYVSMFPFLMPSNLSLNSALVVWDSSASQLTLQVVVGLVLFALPIALLISRLGFCFSKCNSERNEPVNAQK